MMTLRRIRPLFWALLCTGLIADGPTGAMALDSNTCVGFSAAEVPQPTVNCESGAESAADCTVDAGTANGFAIYIDNCARCHGHGVGPKVGLAPNLADRPINYEQIHFILYHGHDEDLGVMPSWRGNCDVIPRIDEIYLYLKARADGSLPPGRPKSQ